MGNIHIKHLVCDLNGTLAFDNQLIQDVEGQIFQILSTGIQIHLVTADIHGSADKLFAKFNTNIHKIDKNEQANQKMKYIASLGGQFTVAIGNGVNDSLMLKEAIIGITVLGDEGLSTKVINNADIIAPNINRALELLLKPKRLIASLKS